jgi:hypothetical protein
MPQTEYFVAYLLIFGLIFLGLLTTCIPRPRKSDLKENLEREKQAGRESTGNRPSRIRQPK